MDYLRMFYIRLNYHPVFNNAATYEQKNCPRPNQASGFMATEACLYLAAACILVAASTKIIHYQIIFMHRLLKKQYKNYQQINVISELQQDLLLPAKIIPLINAEGQIGLKIARKKQPVIDWQFKPNVQRGINGSWTKLYQGQIIYELTNQHLLIDFSD
jgi:hypothetical protein